MRFNVQLASAEGSAREARRLIRLELEDRLPAIALYDLLTVATELVTNAVRHGEGEVVGLSVRVADDGTITGEVENEGRGRVVVRPIDTAGAGGGLGLHIVDALADRWSATSVDGVTRVRFELSAG